MKKKILHLLLLFGIFSISFKTNQISEENPLKLYLPDDLKVELWAQSPMLFNPTNMDTDSKGRIWVTEGVNYRNFNNDSTKFFHQNKGDRIMILSDTDQDGKADKSHVFVQDKDLVAPLGIAVLGNEIFVSCAPYLLKYTDTDGDDKPDKKEIFLKGFGGFDHDHSLHSVVGGPDGSLHFNVGNAGPHNVTDKSGFTLRSGSLYTGGTPYNMENKGNQLSDDGKIWVGGLQLRIKPDGTGLKVMGHNFRNSYETYVDGNGDMWQNDNDDQVVACRVSWLAEGGNAGFFSEDGTRYWSADQRPNQDMFTAHWHQADPGAMPAGDNSGAGSPTGMLRNEGDGLGQKYRGMVLSADAGRNVLFGYQPKLTQSGYNLKGNKSIFLSSNPSDDIAYEWNNKNFLEDKSKWFRPSDMLIGTDGALYVADWYDAVVGGHQMKDKDSYGRIYRISPKNKNLKNPKIRFNTIENQLLAFKNPAINVRFQAYKHLLESNKIEPIIKLTRDLNPFIKARATWLLAAMGEKGRNFVISKFKIGNEAERIVAFRALRQNMDKKVLLKIIKASINDPSAFVRREAILATQDFDFIDKEKLIKSFAEKIPSNDKYYLNAIKLALYNQGDEFYEKNKQLLESKFDLIYTLHPKNSVNYFEKIANNETEKIEKRKKAITAIGFINSVQAVQSMFSLKLSKTQQISQLASYWLSFKSTNDWQELHNWADAKEEIAQQSKLTQMLAFKEILLNENIAFGDRKSSAIQMAKNETGSQILLELMSANVLSADITEIVTPLLLNNSDATIKYQAKNILGDQIVAFNEKEITSSNGNATNGKELFVNNCSSCHKIGDFGKSIGPELTKIHEKLDKTGLYEALIYPSSSIVFGFENYTIKTKNGNSFFGFVLSENEKSITIKDLSEKSHTILQSQIISKTKDKKSIMPSVQSLELKADQLTDLLEYLAKNK